MTTPLRQLRTSEVANVRRQLAAEQKYICPICKGSITQGSIALDHSHKNGMIRATLCSLCNRNEGKVLKAMRYMAPKGHPVWGNPVVWLRSLADFLEYHQNNPSGLVHPSFDLATGKQKPIKRKKKGVPK